MAQIRTTISINPELIRQTDRLAQKRRWSRSEVIERALGQFFEHWEAEQMLAKLNKVYARPLSREEKIVLDWARTEHRRRLESGEQW